MGTELSRNYEVNPEFSLTECSPAMLAAISASVDARLEAMHKDAIFINKTHRGGDEAVEYVNILRTKEQIDSIFDDDPSTPGLQSVH